ncbi:MAG: hypothetical protein R3B09_27625 [Nannocystaceae bacterium]
MPLVPPALAYGALITAVIAARILQERALRKLTTEEKGRLVEAFSGFRMVALIPLAAIAALYFTMSSLDLLTTTTLLAIYFPALLVFMVVMHAVVRRKLLSLGVHPDYVRAHAIGRALVFVGIALVMLAF